MCFQVEVAYFSEINHTILYSLSGKNQGVDNTLSENHFSLDSQLFPDLFNAVLE